MSNISTDRILKKLDEHLYKNDYASAEKHLLYWLDEVSAAGDIRAQLLIRNELMGLYRKLSREEEALSCVSTALDLIKNNKIEKQVGSATTFLNCATVYKAFGMAEKSVPLFEAAREIYERELDVCDSRLGGLYNNMGLALVDLRIFDEARELYEKAIAVMEKSESGALEVAITYLNMASAAEAELGIVDADDQIQSYLETARGLLENYSKKDGYYAFVCEKCASVFEYYGHFFYANEIRERSRRIYENEGT